jgi:hypothetical protein
MTQQCQPDTSVTGQSLAGEGATVHTARNGPAVMAVAGGRKQRSSRQPSSRPLLGQRHNPLPRREDGCPSPVPRMARARATAAPRTTRPVALTLRQDRRRLWQAKQATLHLCHNDRVKKGAPHHSILYPFPLPLSLSYNRDRERGYPERDPSPRRKQAPSPLLIRGSKAGPLEGFNSRLRALGLRAHYWSEVRRPAPQKGSTAASGHSGSAPTTDQGFVGWPSKGFDSHLRRRARDDPGYVRYITKARATLPRYPRTFLRPTGTIFVTESHQREASSPRTPSKGDRVRQIARRYFWSAPPSH